ncbi:MAG: PHP domain-containing protein [Anaerolineaceae bacterium]
MSIGDFHLHSTASDGVHTPTWVMETAASRGVQVLSLTDHDSTEGFAEAKQAGGRLGLRLVPGIELSTDLGKADVHLLGFGVNIASKPLQEFLSWQREGRIGRTKKMVELLHANGMPVKLERVLEIAGEATVGRPHVARALVEAGYVSSVQEAFDLWLGNGKAIDVNREKLDPVDAIKIIHENGGVVFVAHAIYIGDDYPAAVEKLCGWGLDGIETFYKHYDEATIAKHQAIASKLGLATSGGSDYHGLGNPDDHEIGDIPFPDDEVHRFVTFLEARGVNTGVKGKG